MPGGRVYMYNPSTKRHDRGYYRNKKKKQTTATKALTKVRRIERMIEVKHSDINDSGTCTQAGDVTNLTSISQGDTSVTRSGDKISPTSFKMKYYVRFNTSATQPVSVRVLLVQAKSIDAASTYTVSDILDLTPASGEEHLSNYTWNQSRRFRVLYDKIHCLFDTGGMYTQIHGYINIPGKRLHTVRFNPGSATQVTYGGLNLIMLSDEPTNPPSWNAVGRLAFKDA